MSERQPTIYIPHGGGPCFFMEWTMGPPDTWDAMGTWLRGLGTTLPGTPRALLVISAHWEAPRFSVTTKPTPTLLYDYSGFPPHTYELEWPAPGAPDVAARVGELLGAAGVEVGENEQRGLDHGVFIPLKLTYPDAAIPTLQLSLRRGLDPAEHLAIGRALAPLRDEGVLIIGSGMSYHNMRAFNRPVADHPSAIFDAWLDETIQAEPEARDARLTAWETAPSARDAHPREEHLLPLMVVAGAAGTDRGSTIFRDHVMSATVSAHRFG